MEFERIQEKQIEKEKSCERCGREINHNGRCLPKLSPSILKSNGGSLRRNVYILSFFN